MARPKQGEYSPFQETYLKAVEGDDAIKVLQEQLVNVSAFFYSIPAEKEEYAYAENKWTVKEVIEHIIDSEIIFAYRALCIARGEKQVLPGFEQDDYVKEATSNNRKLSELIEEFIKVREADISLFKSFNEVMLSKMGNVYDYHVTVNALLFLIAGHTNHHLNVLKEKYLK